MSDTVVVRRFIERALSARRSTAVGATLAVLVSSVLVAIDEHDEWWLVMAGCLILAGWATRRRLPRPRVADPQVSARRADDRDDNFTCGADDLLAPVKVRPGGDAVRHLPLAELSSGALKTTKVLPDTL